MRLTLDHRSPPPGLLRVVGSDDQDDWKLGDYPTLHLARHAIQEERLRRPGRFYVYDEHGNMIWSG